MAKLSIEKEDYIRRINFAFDNGLRLSIVFGAMTYSDNYDKNTSENVKEKAEKVELAVIHSPSGKFITDLILKANCYGGDDVRGYVKVSSLPKIILRVKEFDGKNINRILVLKELEK